MNFLFQYKKIVEEWIRIATENVLKKMSLLQFFSILIICHLYKLTLRYNSVSQNNKLNKARMIFEPQGQLVVFFPLLFLKNEINFRDANQMRY